MAEIESIDIVFDGPPGPECGRFVETEDGAGHSVGIGDWIQRDDGHWVLRIQVLADGVRRGPHKHCWETVEVCGLDHRAGHHSICCDCGGSDIYG